MIKQPYRAPDMEIKEYEVEENIAYDIASSLGKGDGDY